MLRASVSKLEICAQFAYEHSYVVTSHGKPIAKIIPIGRHYEIAAGARTVLLSRLRSEPVVKIGRWTRDELYEDAR